VAVARLLLLLIATLAAGALLVEALPSRPAQAANDGTTGITYDGAFDNPTAAPGSDPGTVSVTLTSDQSALVRVDVENLILSSKPGSGIPQSSHGREVYYAPPLLLVDGSTRAALQLNYFGMVQSDILVNVHVDSTEQVSGTVQLHTFGSGFGEISFDLLPFTAGAPHEFPPDVPATIFSARTLEDEGSITFALDDNRTMPYFTLRNVVAPPCFTEPITLTVVPAQAKPLEAGLGVLINNRHHVGFGGQRIGNVYSGTLGFGDLDCQGALHWTTAANRETAVPNATATAQRTAPAPELPKTGTGNAQGTSSPIPIRFALALALAALALVSLRRRITTG
jgi:hypothetical protein